MRVALRIGIRRDDGGLGRRAAPPPVPHVQEPDAVAPVGDVGDPVEYPDVVEVLPRRVDPPPPDLLRGGGIGDVDDVDVERPVVDRVDEVVDDEGVVHAAGEIFRVGRDHRRMGGIGQVEENDPVSPVRRALPGDDGDRRVAVHLHVVDDPRIHHHRVGEDGRGRVRHVPRVHLLAALVRPDVGVVAAVHPRKTQRSELVVW